MAREYLQEMVGEETPEAAASTRMIIKDLGSSRLMDTAPPRLFRGAFAAPSPNRQAPNTTAAPYRAFS